MLRPAPTTVTLLLLCACQASSFHTEYRGEATLQGSTTPAPITAFPPVGSFTNIDFSQNPDFRAQRISKDQVSSVKVDGVRVQILSPGSQDFSFLGSLQFFAIAGDQEVEVARKFSIDQIRLSVLNPMLVLDTTRVELKPYITAPFMSFVGRASGMRPPNDTRLQIVVSMLIEAKPLQ